MYKKNKFVILLLLLVIILYSIIYDKYKIKEDFYTFFIPFYKEELPIKKEIYNIKISNKNFIKNEFIYRPLNFGLVIFDSKEDNINIRFINKIIRILLKSTNILEINIVKLKDIFLATNMLNTGKLDLLYCSKPILNKILSEERNYKNIEYICALNFEYVYLISNIKNKYTSFSDIKGKKIGILNINNYSFIKYKLILGELSYILNYTENKDYYIRYSNSLSNLFVLLDRGEIDFIFLCDSFPSLDINKIFKYDIMNKLYLIPIKLNNSILSSVYKYYVKTSIDLNYIVNYLPKKIKDIRQTRFKPDLETYKYINLICSNKNLNEKIGYEITKAIYNNLDYLNEGNIRTNTMLFKNNMVNTPNLINYNKGSFKFYLERGYISYNPDPLCKKLVGSKKCTENTLMNFKLI
jgi:uncharacterized protein